jgi:hypothetical protein
MTKYQAEQVADMLRHTYRFHSVKVRWDNGYYVDCKGVDIEVVFWTVESATSYAMAFK